MTMFSNGFKILKKYITQTIIMIIMATICFYLVGAIISTNNKNQSSVKKFKDTYGNKTLYYTSEFLSEVTYYSYREDKNRISYDRLHSFLNSLYNSDEFTFTSFSRQVLQITSVKVPEQFLYGYEEGYGNESVITMDDETSYAAKSIQVSSSYFEEFEIKIQNGEGFSEEDYIFREDKPIPVLLGNAYVNTLKIGDEFEGYYLCNKCKFKVVGFVAENSFFYDRSSNNMISCERYMIIPSVISGNNDDFAKISLLDHVNGFINSSIGYEATLELFNQYLDESGIGDWEIKMIYSEAAKKSNILETYSSMTDEVSKQFKIIVIVILIFSSVINIAIICSMLRENFQTFGVELLCGASFKNLISESAVVIAVLMLVSDFFASALLCIFSYPLTSVFIVQITVLTIMILSCVVCSFYINNMKLNNYLGGKE